MCPERQRGETVNLLHFVLRGFESHRPNSDPGRQAPFRDFAIQGRTYNSTLFMAIRKINTDAEYFYNGEVVKFNMADYLGLDYNGDGVLMKIHLAAPPKKDGCCGERVHCLVRMCDLDEFKNECPNRYVVVLLIDEPVFSYTPLQARYTREHSYLWVPTMTTGCRTNSRPFSSATSVRRPRSGRCGNSLGVVGRLPGNVL